MPAQRVDHHRPAQDASAEELAANRVKDLTLGSVASLSGAPQVSIPVVTESYAIGLGVLTAPGNDARLLHPHGAPDFLTVNLSERGPVTRGDSAQIRVNLSVRTTPPISSRVSTKYGRPKVVPSVSQKVSQ